MATTRTRAELVLDVLERLGVAAAGQTVEIEDSNRVNSKLLGLMAEVARREIVYIADIEAIPEEWFNSLAAMVAFECRGAFGVAGEEEDKLRIQSDDGIGKLKVMNSGRPTYERLVVEYF